MCHSRLQKTCSSIANATCDFLLLNRNGAQFSKLTEAFSKLVFDAIGKNINSTRYRQIIETESSSCLDNEVQEWISEDQKHTSHVARICYQKKSSRNVALKGQGCLKNYVAKMVSRL